MSLTPAIICVLALIGGYCLGDKVGLGIVALIEAFILFLMQL